MLVWVLTHKRSLLRLRAQLSRATSSKCPIPQTAQVGLKVQSLEAGPYGVTREEDISPSNSRSSKTWEGRRGTAILGWVWERYEKGLTSRACGQAKVHLASLLPQLPHGHTSWTLSERDLRASPHPPIPVPFHPTPHKRLASTGPRLGDGLLGSKRCTLTPLTPNFRGMGCDYSHFTGRESGDSERFDFVCFIT